MKLVITKEWLKRAIELEGDDEVAAGALARDPTHNSADEQAAGDRRIIGANLEKTCRARDFYSGFYVDHTGLSDSDEVS